MIAQSFNDGWAAGPTKTGFGSFAAGPEPVPVTLPHDALRDSKRTPDSPNGTHTAFYPSGRFTYTKTFDAPAEWSERTVLVEFEGAYRDAVVSVNGDMATQRPDGYSAFTVDLGPFLRYGEENTISVATRNHEDSRWYTGAGLFRDTWLHVGPLVHIPPHGVLIATPDIDSEQASIDAAITVRNSGRQTSTVRITTRVLDADGTEVATATAPVTVLPGTQSVSRLRSYVTSPKLWSVNSPSLYSLETRVSGDGFDEQIRTWTFGIRKLQLDPVRGLRINGETVKLRGACVHHDNGPLGSATIARAEERRVEKLKAAGFNAIRSAHNQVSRAMLDACDRHGMLMMDELTDIWTEPKSAFDHSASFPEWWERDVESMVAKDFNHPSVILYSIGNEIPELGRPHGASWGRLLAEKIRELDPTRYVTNAVNCLLAAGDALRAPNEDAAEDGSGGDMFRGDLPEEADINAMITSLGDQMSLMAALPAVSERLEETFGVLDVAGVNYGEARYALDRQESPNRVLVGSETLPGRLDILWPLVENNPNVIGDFAWTGWDYLGETGIGRAQFADEKSTGIYSPYPWLTASCGSIDITGHRRPISYWRETVWGLRSEPYVAVRRPQNHDREEIVGAWSWHDSVSSWSWEVPVGAPVTVEVYSDADEIELLLDGTSVARGRVGEQKAFMAVFETRFRPGALTAVAYSAGEETGSTTLHSVMGNISLALEADRTQIRADGNDLAYIDIVLSDVDGNVASHQDRPVTVTIEGPGVLAGFGSARPDSTEGFHHTTHTTFDGRVLAIVRPTAAGEITLTASSAGMSDAVVVVTAG